VWLKTTHLFFWFEIEARKHYESGNCANHVYSEQFEILDRLAALEEQLGFCWTKEGSMGVLSRI